MSGRFFLCITVGRRLTDAWPDLTVLHCPTSAQMEQFENLYIN
jgi:hypothetical protein